MRYKYNFTKEQIEDAAAKSESKTEMMRILKIKQGGGGYQALEHWCKKYGVISPKSDLQNHWKKNLKKHQFKSMPDEEWFVEGVFRNGQRSKKRILARGVPDMCSICGLNSTWNGMPLTLQIDHIDGDRWNNVIENLRIVCPNCHTQTKTFSNNGIRRARTYCACGSEMYKKSKFCNKCTAAMRKRTHKIEWPSVEEVIEQVRLTNFSAYARVLGVSDNAVRAHLRRNEVDLKSI